MTRHDYTHISFVLDQSGSMQSVAEPTCQAFNRFVANQRGEPGKTTFSLTLFNTDLDSRYVFADIRDVRQLYVAPPVVHTTPLYDPPLWPDGRTMPYRPGGMTALFDAVASVIDHTGDRLSQIPEHERPARVLFVVQTDGHENSSRHNDQRSVVDRRQRQEDVYGWTFMFLGADQDAWNNPLGVRAGNTISYDAGSVQQAFATMDSHTHNYRQNVNSAGRSVALAAAPVDHRHSTHSHDQFVDVDDEDEG